MNDLKNEIEILTISLMEARTELAALRQVLFPLAQKQLPKEEFEEMAKNYQLNIYSNMLDFLEGALPSFPESKPFRNAYFDYKELLAQLKKP